jgi:hypothetical protein
MGEIKGMGRKFQILGFFAEAFFGFLKRKILFKETIPSQMNPTHVLKFSPFTIHINIIPLPSHLC